MSVFSQLAVPTRCLDGDLSLRRGLPPTDGGHSWQYCRCRPAFPSRPGKHLLLPYFFSVLHELFFVSTHLVDVPRTGDIIIFRHVNNNNSRRMRGAHIRFMAWSPLVNELNFGGYTCPTLFPDLLFTLQSSTAVAHF